MRILSAELHRVCGAGSAFPENEFPEIALAGRSNVGKSSFVNTIVNRKSLARTSQTPGKTETVNYYLINKSFFFVDLPGYGYAAKSGKTVSAWGGMIERYLKNSKALRSVFLLLDLRRTPNADDELMYRWIVENGFTPPVLILTKADKLSRNERARQKALIHRTFPEAEHLITFSSFAKEGIEEVTELLDTLVNN
ncbi:MAG: YihA family ribosome biogenesis GTP-binding protein [Lachnospiraceae bacterium]|nr:YihA family ribosome biogenesis GTP-binding protein [Lachnospiraceae bacterium]